MPSTRDRFYLKEPPQFKYQFGKKEEGAISGKGEEEEEWGQRFVAFDSTALPLLLATNHPQLPIRNPDYPDLGSGLRTPLPLGFSTFYPSF
jgi:hypothetical protein